jgi:hypothetical protein
MKRCVKAVLGVVLLAFAASYLWSVPAEAAKPAQETQTMTYRGYTLSWSTADASDLRVTRSGRAEHFPAGASQRSINDAKARVNAASESTTEATDSCNFVPDSFLNANFQPACDTHDECYSSSTARRACDDAFLANLLLACNQAYPTYSPEQVSCYAVAYIYYVGVRLFGAAFYTGTGSPR